MTQAQLIEAVLNAPPDRQGAILAAARGVDRKRPGTVRQAAGILGVHPRTVGRYERRGLLHAIRITQRKVRYDLNEVERLAERGAVAEPVLGGAVHRAHGMDIPG